MALGATIERKVSQRDSGIGTPSPTFGEPSIDSTGILNEIDAAITEVSSQVGFVETRRGEYPSSLDSRFIEPLSHDRQGLRSSSLSEDEAIASEIDVEIRPARDDEGLLRNPKTKTSSSSFKRRAQLLDDVVIQRLLDNAEEPAASISAKQKTRPSSQEVALEIVEKTHEGVEKALKVYSVAEQSAETMKETMHISRSLGRHLKELNLSVGMPFEALEGLSSLYIFLKNGYEGLEALTEGRYEEVRDHSGEMLRASVTGSAAGIGLSFTITELAEKGWETIIHAAHTAAESGALEMAAHQLSIAGWIINGVVQGVHLKRLAKPMLALSSAYTESKSTITPEMKGAYEVFVRKHLTEENQMEALHYILKRFYVTEEQKQKIFAKHKEIQYETYFDEDLQKEVNAAVGSVLTEEGQAKALKEIEEISKKRFKKFEKLVGKENATALYKDLAHIDAQLRLFTLPKYKNASHYENEKRKFEFQVNDFLVNYQEALAKNMIVRGQKLLASVLGLIASGVAFANPVAGVVLAGVAAGYMLYVFVQKNRLSPEEFAQKKLFGKNLFDFGPRAHHKKATPQRGENVVIGSTKDGRPHHTARF